MAEGTGEFFALSVKPIYRDTFLLGTAEQKEQRATAWKLVPSALWREDRGEEDEENGYHAVLFFLPQIKPSTKTAIIYMAERTFRAIMDALPI